MSSQVFDNEKQQLEILKQLENLEDLCNFLGWNYLEIKQVLFKKSWEEKYIRFYISKKNGAIREINAPTGLTLEIQKKLYQILTNIYKLNLKASVHGFVLERNIVTNAENHCGKKFVLNIDIKDFFPSITQKRIRGVLMSPPYSLKSKVATSISHLCCLQGKLPQGSPTSPILSNIVCGKLDSELRLLAKKYRCFYTRYADDITFSTTSTTFSESLAIIKGCKPSDVTLGDELVKIFQNNGFEINYSKVRIQKNTQKQEVTGLIVNQKPNVSRKYIREIRAMLYDWHKNGYIPAEMNHLSFRFKQNKGLAYLHNVLRGKIDFIGQVRGKDDDIYKKLLAHYHSLIEREIIRQRSLNFNDDHYFYWCKNVDKYCCLIINKYIENENISVQEIREGFDELNKLKQRKDPDYDLSGVPVAYAFMYLPRKIIAMTATLCHFFKEDKVFIPKNLLDVGSGTDAVSIALGLFRHKINLNITAIEPNEYMRRFAICKPNFPNLKIENVKGSIGYWHKPLSENYYDLIIMSSVLQNSFYMKYNDWWLKWTKDLYEASTKLGKVIIIEPSMKFESMNKMRSAMEDVGWNLQEELKLSDLLPQVSRKGRVLENLTELKKELIGSYWQWDVKSWNTYHKYNEYIHIYGK
jgi:RNA-directed DNA polymerase